jgi:anti-anti-sigma factor
VADEVRNEGKVVAAELAPGVWVLRLSGPQDGSTTELVGSELDELFGRGVYRIVVNLKETSFISSSGFSSFLNAMYTASGNEGDLVFVGTPPSSMLLFKKLGLANALRFADTEEAALGLLKA